MLNFPLGYVLLMIPNLLIFFKCLNVAVVQKASEMNKKIYFRTIKKINFESSLLGVLKNLDNKYEIHLKGF